MIDLSTRLQGTAWHGWQQCDIIGDASARQFARLTDPQGATVVAMITPSTEAESQRAFIRISTWLTDQGMTAPRVLHTDQDLLILTDLGTKDMAGTLATQPNDADTLYGAATDILLKLHKLTPPPLPIMTPAVAGEMVEITATMYCNASERTAALAEAVTRTMTAHVGSPSHIALRDFHAENLIWRPQAQGHDRMGLIDFQDAFIAPAGYDLASLLRDARRDVSDAIYDKMVDRFSAKAKLNPTEFRAQMATLAVQRNLRILGVFARLAREMNKTRYLPMLPRVWNHIQTDLKHPALADLAKVVIACVPDPATATRRWGLL